MIGIFTERVDYFYVFLVKTVLEELIGHEIQ